MRELSKSYDPKAIESEWYQFWEKQGFFIANPSSSKPPYCIVMPPPNVTGALHMGHALVSTLQDILIRWKRMSGYEVLWVPGTDHAGISTQTVVERHLMKTQGKKRKDFQRETFLEHVWQWKEEKQSNILNQLKRVGCSCDWSRLRFTMDNGNNRAVRSMFKKMYDDRLIYRGDYLVNWDPLTQTALADDEVEYEERNSFLWHFKYPLKDGSGYVKIATTRPETMLGDTAIAVSPKDLRYTHLIGKHVVLPLVEREIPIISDHHVDPEFGTGMVKITPAHDPNDYQVGINHNLPFVNIMTPDGKINAQGGAFEGLSMQEARQAVVEALKNLGLLEKIEPHIHRVGVSYRSKAVIEPYMSKQWFVNMEEFGKKLRKVIEDGKIDILPKSWETTYYHWVDNLRDWCISRQLWWGHRIPIWYAKDNPKKMICYDGEGEPEEVKKNPNAWIQDEDVLDTWFSSALWPFSTLGWPEKTPELRKFYPNSVLITGHDILFFWVARMIVMGEYALSQPPFSTVFLHGLIYGKSYWRVSSVGEIAYLNEGERREYELGKPMSPEVKYKWEKMSKTKGNIIDPLEIIDDYGTDAMRMALCSSANQGREIDLDRRRFEDFKNFANKIWNGARFVLMNLQGEGSLTPEDFYKGLDEDLLSLEDQWILSKLTHTVQNVNKSLGSYLFDQAATEAYDFFWKDFCSYYVEISKPILFGKQGSPLERKNKQKLLLIILNQALRLIHPMAPFITEELFQVVKKEFYRGLVNLRNIDPYSIESIQALAAPACIVAPYPQVIRENALNIRIEEAFELVERVVYTIRNIRGEMKLAPGIATDIHIIGQQDDPQFNLIIQHINIISALVKTKAITTHHTDPHIDLASIGLLNAIKIIIPIPPELLKQEEIRLTKEKERLENLIQKSQTQLSNQEFVNNAPEQLVAKQQAQLLQAKYELHDVETKLSSLNRT